MKKLLILFVSLLVFDAAADSYYVEKVSGAAADSSKQAVYSLISDSLSSKGHSLVSGPSANWTLAPSLTQLGDAYIISVKKKKNGQVVFAEKLKAKELSDADTVVDRLVDSVVAQVSVAKTQTVDNVTETERAGTTIKTKALRQFFVGFGPGAVVGLDTKHSGFNLLAGFLWGLDHQFSLRINYEGIAISDSHASVADVSIGGQYYLNRNSHSPYGLGMINYAWAESDVEEPGCSLICTGIDEHGWGAKVGLGYHFYRTSTVNFAIETSYTHGFFTVLDENPGYYALKLVVLW